MSSAGHTALPAAVQVEKVAIKTTGISCGTCAAVSEIYLRRLPSIDKINISMKNEPVLVSYKPGSWFQPKDLHRHTPQLAAEHALPYPGRPIGSLCGEIPPRVVGNIFSAHTGISFTPTIAGGRCNNDSFAGQQTGTGAVDRPNVGTDATSATFRFSGTASAFPRRASLHEWLGHLSIHSL